MSALRKDLKQLAESRKQIAKVVTIVERPLEVLEMLGRVTCRIVRESRRNLYIRHTGESLERETPMNLKLH
jgi:hypothetical protein